MPRRPRDIAPGHHHVWVNATGGVEYYVDSVDRIAWVRCLVGVLKRMGWTCPAFCQMSTHVHLLVSTPDRSLPIGMRDLNRQYSYGFNIRHDRIGTFLRKRYGSRRIEDGEDLLATYSYVVLNPVVEGLCPRAEDWRWSSYRTSVGLSTDFPFVDAADVIAEAGGSLDALRRTLESVARTRLEQPRLGTWFRTCP
jgi:REP element-mobilizing transposase RayT